MENGNTNSRGSGLLMLDIALLLGGRLEGSSKAKSNCCCSVESPDLSVWVYCGGLPVSQNEQTHDASPVSSHNLPARKSTSNTHQKDQNKSQNMLDFYTKTFKKDFTIHKYFLSILSEHPKE